MWYILIAGFLIAGFALGSKFIGNSSKPNYTCSDNKIVHNRPLNVNDTIKAMFSKKQLDQKLKRLAETLPPKIESFGAMCYDMSVFETPIHEYVCPVCGEKTIYRRDQDEIKFRHIDNILSSELAMCRNEMKKVKGINIKLDEIEFCIHCSPKAQNPKLYMLVNIAGQTDTTRISNFNYMDIRLIHEFLDDKLVHRDDQDFESPLKDNIERIKELLGFK